MDTIMEDIQKTAVKKVSMASFISIMLIITFSIPLGIIPPVGNLFFPGDGIWDLPGEVPEYEQFTINALSSNVTVLRDEWGIPHIYGKNESDIVYALGYVHAQDRLFQMDMARRLTRGKLSEIMGPDALPVDKFNLNMMKDYWANETVNQMIASTDPEIQKIYSILVSYIAGVNFYIENNLDNLPFEFKLLNYRPDPWTMVDTFSFAKYMAEDLTWGYTDFMASIIVESIGLANYTALFGLPKPYQIPICPNYGEFSDISVPSSILDAGESISTPESSSDGSMLNVKELSNAFISAVSEIPQEKERIDYGLIKGSNNWAVNGSKTESGMPILANDMHLGFNLPGIWYEAHLVNTNPAEDWNVYGFFLAGVPVPIVGHNAEIAWGFTNVAYDVLDWYYYNKVDDDHYMYKGASTAFEELNYDIKVKGQEPVEYTIKSTVHGPEFSGLLAEDLVSSGFENYFISSKWIAQNVTWEFLALYKYTHSSNRAEFNAASEFFGAPAQNHIYADVHGTIGIRPTGKVPIRDDTTYGLPAGHTGNGTMPYNGSKGEGEWIGYVPFNDLANCENPDQGYLASANQISAGPDFLKDYSLQHPLGIASGYRGRRINTLLASNDDITVEDMKNFQLDVYSTRAGNFTPSLLTAMNTLSSKTTIQQSVYDLLSDWDFIMDKDGVEATIFNVWIEIFREETYGDDLANLEIPGVTALPDYPVLEKITRENLASSWFDDITTTIVEDGEDIMLNALNTALTALEEYFGTSDINKWIWGDIHQRAFPHLTEFESLSAGPYPVNGTGYTVTPSWGSNWRDGEVRESISYGGASERLIVDFSDLNKSISVIPSGERGVTTSNHYTDQLELYLVGDYHPQYFGAESIIAFQDQWIESTISFLSGGA
jgi:penicillin amidase